MIDPDSIPSLNSPIESLNPDSAEGARLYPRLVATLVLGMLAYIPLVYWIGGPLAQIAAPIFILLGSAISWGVHRSGHTRRAILIVLWILLLAILVQGCIRGGLINPALHGLVVLMLVGGWLVGPRQGLILGFGSVIGTWLVAVGVDSDLIHPAPIATGLSYWVAQATVTLMGLFMMWSVLKAHWRYLRQARGLNEELQEKVRALSARDRALAASESRFAVMHNTSPTPVTVSRIDDGRYLSVNPAWSAMFGWSLEEARGKTSVEIGFFQDPEDRRRGLDQFRRDGRVQLEIAAQSRQGRQYDLMCSAEMIDYEGAKAVLTTMFDLTERKRAENELRRLNDELEHRVAERTSALESAVRDLNNTVDHLHKTQDDLVQAEKHASLGRLVAGVAHELNTPIGNALTASTTLSEELGNFEMALKSGDLKRSQLTRLIEFGRAGSDIVERSLRRAAMLVQSFKQVAVDQASERRRHFTLASVVTEVTATLRPSFGKVPWSIVVAIPEEIELDSYPGPLGQIVMNLVSNAAAHAFVGKSSGQVTLTANADGDFVELYCHDDGVGITPEIIGRVFDPFFTTTLGRGGSGLGLAIVQQLATQLLRGQISVESNAGAGATFLLRIPTVTPVAAA